MASRNESIFDDAAEESDDQQQEDEEQAVNEEGQDRPPSQAGSDVDSSDEEEGGNEYDMTDKFIAPEDEEDAGDESESDQEGGRRKKRKRRRREEEELDEEDFALLEEQGVRVDVSAVPCCAMLYAYFCYALCAAEIQHICCLLLRMLSYDDHGWQIVCCHQAGPLPESSHLVLQNIRRKQAAQRKRIRKRQDESAARQSARTAEEQVQHVLFGEQADAGQLKQDTAADLVIMLVSAVPGLMCCMHACTMMRHACSLRA